MKYRNTVKAKFIERPNRFIAKVLIDGKEETVHVKNTGRCAELLLPGAEVILAASDNVNRKTAYDLICVNKPGIGWINIDSQAPNVVVGEWLSRFPEITYIKPEYTIGKSRIDFYIESGVSKILMEVKGVTLERDGTGYFPDAPTERGIKHLTELSDKASEGYECFLAFVIQMPGITKVLPNTGTHPEFGEALINAQKAGVKVLFLECNTGTDELTVSKATVAENYV